MYEKILVPLDGSELAEVALPYAEELAGRLGSEIILIYVSELTKDPGDKKLRSYLQKMVEATKDGASKYSNKPGIGPAVEVKSIILSGSPAEKIVEYADNENIGLIVISTHGQSGIKRWALGSVADKVVRATIRPVALIRAKGARPDMRGKGMLNKVLVSLDGSKEGEAIIPYIEELASRLKVKVILLKVLARGYYASDTYIPLPDQQIESDKALATAYLNNVGARLKEKGIAITIEERLDIEIRFGNEAEQIIQFADELHADLLAMTTHGRSGVGRWVFGSVAEKVLHEGNTPLLLVRSPGARGEQ
ncbi:MAG: universal stress protein [Dehalococcoidia bacterium]|jgi:nucleotide-binding universal stress UspA family protein